MKTGPNVQKGHDEAQLLLPNRTETEMVWVFATDRNCLQIPMKKNNETFFYFIILHVLGRKFYMCHYFSNFGNQYSQCP